MHVTRLSPNPQCPTHKLYDPIDQNELIVLPIRSETATVAELLNAVKQKMGKEAVIQLDYDLVTHYFCPEHHYRLPLIRRRGYVFADEVECPHCKAQGLPHAYLLMQEHFVNRFPPTPLSPNRHPPLPYPHRLHLCQQRPSVPVLCCGG